MGISEPGRWGWRTWTAAYNLCVVKIRLLLYTVLRTQLIFRPHVYKVLLAASYGELSAHLAWFKAFEINDGWICFREQNLICAESWTIELSDCSKTLLLSPCRGNIVQLAFRDQYKGDVNDESLCVADKAFSSSGFRCLAYFLGVYWGEVDLWFL